MRNLRPREINWLLQGLYKTILEKLGPASWSLRWSAVLLTCRTAPGEYLAARSFSSATCLLLALPLPLPLWLCSARPQHPAPTRFLADWVLARDQGHSWGDRGTLKLVRPFPWEQADEQGSWPWVGHSRCFLRSDTLRLRMWFLISLSWPFWG